MITDAQLREAAEKSSNIYLHHAEQGHSDVPPHEFSAAFEKKIGRLKKRADHPYFYKTLHKAAAVILAVLIGGSAWLAVDTEARAAFFGWVKEVYEEVFLFRFENGRTVDGVKKDYCLTWIPEGYTKISEDSVGNTSTVVYASDESEILKFYYRDISITENDSKCVVSGDKLSLTVNVDYTMTFTERRTGKTKTVNYVDFFNVKSSDLF